MPINKNLELDSSIEQKLITLENQKLKVDKVINLHVTGSFIIGFTPIPFSDAPILLANQAALIERILSIYNMADLSELVAVLIGNVGIGTFTSSMAKKASLYATDQLLKLLPFIGTIGGGIINAAVAGSLTYAYGQSVSHFCYCKQHELISSHKKASVSKKDIDNFIQVFETCFKNHSS
ncbi:MAG: DUF697 domain-containing protein [Aminipila sp.]